MSAMDAVSIRFRRRQVYERLRSAARTSGQSVSAFSEQLIDGPPLS